MSNLTGPTFSTSVSGNYLVKRLNIFNVSDTGVKTPAENAYSYDDGNTWVKEMSKDYTQNTTVQVCSRDSLDNRSCKTVIISGIDMMDPTVSVSVAKKAAIFTFSDDMGIAGYGVNQSSVNEPDWISSTNTIATWTASSAGTYYVWVKDVAGKIGKAAFTIDQNAFCAYTPGAYWEYNYTGDVQTFAVPCNGTYKLEVYGAQGGSDSYNIGGKGGYSYGSIYLSNEVKLYVVIGGTSNGYNGGGVSTDEWHHYGKMSIYGGGATHIATSDRGILSNYDLYRNEILIVAGGGGGAGFSSEGEYAGGSGGTGGGDSGGTGGCMHDDCENSNPGIGGSQTNGYSFGTGSDLGGYYAGAGGGGWYGGTSGYNRTGGGGGSGYIGGVTNGSMQNGIREGNGYAKITLVTINQS